MPHRCILTPAERTALLAFPSERSELIRLYTLKKNSEEVFGLIGHPEDWVSIPHRT
jgi:hypothetical protein